MGSRKIYNIIDVVPIVGGIKEYKSLRKKGVSKQYALQEAVADEIGKDFLYLLGYTASKFL